MFLFNFVHNLSHIPAGRHGVTDAFLILTQEKTWEKTVETIQVDREVHHQAEEDKVMPEAGRVLQEIHQVEAGATTPPLRVVKTP